MRITNALMNESEQPTDATVGAALGPAAAPFSALKTLTADCEHEWRHYGRKYGWKLRVHAEDKVLFELTVADGWFLVSMALREKERLEFKADPLGELVSPDGFVKLEVRDADACERALALARFVMARRQPSVDQ